MARFCNQSFKFWDVQKWAHLFNLLEQFRIWLARQVSVSLKHFLGLAKLSVFRGRLPFWRETCCWKMENWERRMRTSGESLTVCWLIVTHGHACRFFCFIQLPMDDYRGEQQLRAQFSFLPGNVTFPCTRLHIKVVVDQFNRTLAALIGPLLFSFFHSQLGAIKFEMLSKWILVGLLVILTTQYIEAQGGRGKFNCV